MQDGASLGHKHNEAASCSQFALASETDKGQLSLLHFMPRVRHDRSAAHMGMSMSMRQACAVMNRPHKDDLIATVKLLKPLKMRTCSSLA